jgi:hypothetical protein
VPVGHTQRVSRSLPSLLDDPIHPAAHIGRTFPADHTIGPQCPPRPLGPDLGRRETLVGPVVPLHQVRTELALEASQATGGQRPLQRAGQHPGERHSPQELARRHGLLTAEVHKWNICAAGVLTAEGPFGGTVPEQHHPWIHAT